MTETIREQSQKFEDTILSPHAAHSSAPTGRARDEEECDIRTPFQRDRDRILHSKAFRRLKGKTQVFLSPEGDHYRTRLTHTLEVAQISRTVGRAIRLNEDLAEAIALGHDLGHTPFGHAGEAILSTLVPGGFHHATQSLRVVEVLENGGKGLNLTAEVRNGIRWHSKGLAKLADARGHQPRLSLEAEVVSLCDCVAYTNHDLDDAIRAQVVDPKEIPGEVVAVLGKTYSSRLNTLVHDIVKTSAGQPYVRLSPKVEQALEVLREFLLVHMYKKESLLEAFARAKWVLESLYRHYITYPDTLPRDLPAGDSPERKACDHCAGMTDHYALSQFDKQLMPHPWVEEDWPERP